MDSRHYEQTKRLGDTIRSANSSDPGAYRQFLNIYNPDHEERRKGSGKKEAAISDPLPTGFVYIKK